MSLTTFKDRRVRPLGLFIATVLVLFIPLLLKLTGRKKIAADDAQV